MKIAIICHFTNAEIQDKIKPWKRINEFAPWISYYIEEFKKYPEHEFHIISPHRWLMKDKYYSEKNIHYYFFSWGIPVIGRPWPGFFDFDFITKYWFNKLKVKKYIAKIKPDIINLFGQENSYYSSSIFQFIGKYPILLSIQGFIGRGIKKENMPKSYYYKLEIENKILSKVKDQNLRTDDMSHYAKSINPSLREYRYDYPNPYDRIRILEKEKKYDFVFFAHATKDKGIFDFLEAIRWIKQRKSNVTALILGACSKKMKENIQMYQKQHVLGDNINHMGFMETQAELFDKVKEARISVLPTYNDIISGTIIESMYLKLPVVTYETGSIPEVNKIRENIIICKQGNIQELEQKMLDLLCDEEKQNLLRNNAFEWVMEACDNNKAMNGYFNALTEVIKNFDSECKK